MLLGLFLASMGLLIGSGEKPKKKKEFDKMVGEQSYAFKIKGCVYLYYRLDDTIKPFSFS